MELAGCAGQDEFPLQGGAGWAGSGHSCAWPGTLIRFSMMSFLRPGLQRRFPDPPDPRGTDKGSVELFGCRARGWRNPSPGTALAPSAASPGIFSLIVFLLPLFTRGFPVPRPSSARAGAAGLPLPTRVCSPGLSVRRSARPVCRCFHPGAVPTPTSDRPEPPPACKLAGAALATLPFIER